MPSIPRPEMLVCIVKGHPIHRRSTETGTLFFVTDVSFQTQAAAEAWANTIPKHYVEHALDRCWAFSVAAAEI